MNKQRGFLWGWCYMGVIAVSACRDYDLPSGDERAGQAGELNRSENGGSTTAGEGGTSSNVGAAGGSGANPLEAGASTSSGAGEGGSAGQRVMPGTGGIDKTDAGEGGSAGERVTPGGAGGTGDAGAGGGANEEEPITLSTCIYQYWPIPITPGSAADVAVSLTNELNPYTVFMSHPTTEILTVTWKVSSSVDDDWAPVHCFDRVPSPRRVAASNLVNNLIEVYATTGDGRLYTRQSTSGGYEPWTRLSVPSQTRVLDVAVVDPAGERPALYVATGDAGVYVRTRTSDEPYAAYGAWRQVTSTKASVIAVGVRPDGRHDLVVMDPESNAQELIETKAGAEFEFAEPSPWDFRAKDATFAFDAPGSFKTFALAEDGALLVRAFANGTWQEWSELKKGDVEPHLTTLASGSYPGQPLFLFGVDQYGTVRLSRDTAETWEVP